SRFSPGGDVASVVETAATTPSGRVRDMANPRDDELSADRPDDPREKRQARAGMRKLGAWIREIIKQETSTPPEAEMLLDEMNRVFSTPESGKDIPDPANSQPNHQRIRIKPKT